MTHDPELDSTPLPRLPQRPRDAHKGDFGRVVLIGGSRGMSGAIGLAGMAALRSGAGLVHLAVPRAIADSVAGFEPSYMTWPMPDDAEGKLAAEAIPLLQSRLERADAVAIGPGLGRSDDVERLVVHCYESFTVPLVVDADGLNALAAHVSARPAGPRILTPHPGEFRRLCPDSPRARDAMEAAAIDWAARHGVVLLLKGHRTLITDGSRVARNATGNPGMATGGAGDVLTGILTALLGQRLAPFDAARLAAHVHGLAGDLGAAELGEVALIASDLVRYLPKAFRTVGTAP